MEESNQRFKMCLNAATAKKSNKATDGNKRYRGNAAACAGSNSSTVGEIWDENKALLMIWKHGNLKDARPWVTAALAVTLAHKTN